MACVDDGGFVWMGAEPKKVPHSAGGAAAAPPAVAAASPSAPASPAAAASPGWEAPRPSTTRPSQGTLRRIDLEPGGTIAVRTAKRIVTVALAARRGKRALLVACLELAEHVTSELRRAARAA